MAKQIIEYIEKALPQQDDALEIQESGGGAGSSKKIELINILAAFVDAFPQLTITLGGATAPTQGTISALTALGFSEDNILWVQTILGSASSSPSSSVSASPSVSVSASPSTSPSVSVSESPSVSVSASPSTSVSDSPSSSASVGVSISDSPSTSVSDSPSTSVSESPSTSVSESPSESPSASASDSPSSSPSVSVSSSPSATDTPPDAPTGLSSSNIADTTFTLDWSRIDVSPSVSPSSSPSVSVSDSPSVSPSSSPSATGGGVSPPTISVTGRSSLGVFETTNTAVAWRDNVANASTSNWSPTLGECYAYGEDEGGYGDFGLVRYIASFTIPSDLDTPSAVTVNMTPSTAYGGDLTVWRSSLTSMPANGALTTAYGYTNHDTAEGGTTTISNTAEKAFTIPVAWVTEQKGTQLYICFRPNSFDEYNSATFPSANTRAGGGIFGAPTLHLTY